MTQLTHGNQRTRFTRYHPPGRHGNPSPPNHHAPYYPPRPHWIGDPTF